MAGLSAAEEASSHSSPRPLPSSPSPPLHMPTVHAHGGLFAAEGACRGGEDPSGQWRVATYALRAAVVPGDV
ncbi:unnamed protein product [Closterium sp. NIES-54]